MKWLAFAVVAALTLTLHTTLGARWTVFGARPDWILVVVVFFAMHVRSVDVVVAGWIMGVLGDLQSAERFGLLSIVYALAALFVYSMREHVFRTHPLAQLVVTFLAGLLVQGAQLLYCVCLAGMGGGSWTAQALGGLMIALHSALWAPVVHAALLTLSPHLGVERPRFSHAGLGRLTR